MTYYISILSSCNVLFAAKMFERLLCIYLSWKSIVLAKLHQILIFDIAEKQLTKAVLMSFSIDEDIDMLEGKTEEFLQ